MFLLRKLLLLLALALACAQVWPAQPAWQAPIELARGPGERGPWKQNDSRFLYVDDGTAQFGENGALYTAWVDQAKKDVFFQRRDASGRAIGEPLNISRNPDTFSWGPRIVTLPDVRQVVLVLWQEIIFSGGGHGGDILLARSEDGGASFGMPVNLSASIGGDGKGRINKEIWSNGSQDIATGSNGMVHVAWTEYDGQLWYARSLDAGKNFESPRQVGGNASLPARAPSLAVGKDGRVFLAFTTGENPASDIQLMRSRDAGQSFTQPVAVEVTPGYSDAPRLALDELGGLHLAWAESRAGPFDAYRIRYARSRDQGKSFEPSRALSTTSEMEASSAFPALALRGKQVVLLWEMFARANGPPRGLGMAISENGGQDFGQPFLVPDSVDAGGGVNGSAQGLLMKKLAVDDEGRIAVVNSAMKEGVASRVWLMRGRLPSP